MYETLNIRTASLRIAPIALAVGLAIAPTQASAYYDGGYSGGRYYGGGYSSGRHYGGSRYGGYGGYGYRGYGYRGYGYGSHYGRSYGYYRPRYYGGHGGYYSGYRGGLLYGLLSIPGAVLGAVFGRYDDRSDNSGTYGGGTYGGGSTIAPETTSSAPGGSRDSGSQSLYQSGWARLAEGRYSQALSIFGAEASSHPRDGGPKIGYALSAAGVGDLGRGVWAMRRALRIDPDSIHYLTLDGSLRPQVERVVSQYRNNPGNTIHNADAAFMLASLHYLLRDTASARASLDAALASGGEGASITNLKRLIDKEPASGPQQAGGANLAPPREDGSQAEDGY